MAQTSNQEILEIVMGFLYEPPSIIQPVVIKNDGGGIVDTYIQQAHKYTAQGRRVEIRGSCRSACILALAVPNVCVSPAAQVKAHMAYEEWTGKPRPDVTEKMLRELPVHIRQRFDGKIKVNYSPEATLDYEDLRELNIPDCDKRRPVATDNKQPNVNKQPERKVKFRILNPLEAVLRVFGGEI